MLAGRLNIDTGEEKSAMSDEQKGFAGVIAWTDLTVPDAEEVKEFYSAVVGWESEPVDMGDYSDFNMKPAGFDQAVAGICHARGVNEDLPPQWMVYILVEDLERSVGRCRELGGEVLVGPSHGSWGSYCVIRDPAGAVCALFARSGEPG
jgi:predicted enzyme related to lactoylglutathione lyase